jgi:hypothetical protein
MAATTPAMLANTIRGWSSLSNVLAEGTDAVVPFIVSCLQVFAAWGVRRGPFVAGFSH